MGPFLRRNRNVKVIFTVRVGHRGLSRKGQLRKKRSRRFLGEKFKGRSPSEEKKGSSLWACTEGASRGVRWDRIRSYLSLSLYLNFDCKAS